MTPDPRAFSRRSFGTLKFRKSSPKNWRKSGSMPCGPRMELMSDLTTFDEEMLTTAGNTRLTTLAYPREPAASDRETILTVAGGFSLESRPMVAALTAKKPVAAKAAVSDAVASQRRYTGNLIFIFATS